MAAVTAATLVVTTDRRLTRPTARLVAAGCDGGSCLLEEVTHRVVGHCARVRRRWRTVDVVRGRMCRRAWWALAVPGVGPIPTPRPLRTLTIAPELGVTAALGSVSIAGGSTNTTRPA